MGQQEEAYLGVCCSSLESRPPFQVVVQARIQEVEFPGARLFLGDRHGNPASMQDVPPLVIPDAADGNGGRGAGQQPQQEEGGEGAGGQDQGSGKRRGAGAGDGAAVVEGPSKRQKVAAGSAASVGATGDDRGDGEESDGGDDEEGMMDPITCRVILRAEQEQRDGDDAAGAETADFAWHSAPFRGAQLDIAPKQLGDIIDRKGTYSIVVSAELQPGDVKEAVLCRYQVAYASQEELYKTLEAVQEQLTKLYLKVQSAEQQRDQNAAKVQWVEQRVQGRQQEIALRQSNIQALVNQWRSAPTLENQQMHLVVRSLARCIKRLIVG